MNPTIVCPRGCNTGFGPITNDFQTLGGKNNEGMAVMTVTAECAGCGLLCDNEIVGHINEFHLTTSARTAY